MRPVALALALALAPALAGCTASEPLGGLARDDGPREPYFKDYREVVAPHTERTKVFPVDEGAVRGNVTMLLTQRDSGLPLPPASPATVTFSVLDPTGAVIDTRTVDPSTPEATILLTQLRAGEWSIRLAGTGASGMLEDASFAAEYVLSVEVLYG